MTRRRGSARSGSRRRAGGSTPTTGASSSTCARPTRSPRGRVPGALALPRGRLEGTAAETIPDLEWELIVVCEKGNRSALAADTLRLMGFTNVASLEGGMLAWVAAGHPVGPPRVL